MNLYLIINSNIIIFKLEIKLKYADYERAIA